MTSTLDHKEEVLAWCRANKCKFSNTDPKPPKGWAWKELEPKYWVLVSDTGDLLEPMDLFG